MLTFEDCLGLSELTEDEILAIAEHERIPEIAALELGNFLVREADGEQCIKSFIVDDIEAASRKGDFRRAAVLRLVLRDFCEEHRV